ncbi:MAG: segregation/condensation protein A [Nitrospirota bacterium]|nr:segregation/condensation protein A [Nitrospirota bacterium]
MSYHVKLEIFEGPMDLLLHLIKKHELDIYDIPIAPITQQYLEYIQLMQSLDMEIAGEFLVMASTLTHIKSKMLLPPTDTPDADEEGVDPRAELIRRLLEYKRFKDAAASLEQREDAWSQVYTRESEITPELPAEDQPLLFDFHLFDLLAALRDVMNRVPDSGLEITAESVSITEKIAHILSRLESVDSMLFADLFEKDTTKAHVIATFMALLELMKNRVVKAVQVEQFGAIRLMKSVNEQPSTMNLYEGM